MEDIQTNENFVTSQELILTEEELEGIVCI